MLAIPVLGARPATTQFGTQSEFGSRRYNRDILIADWVIRNFGLRAPGDGRPFSFASFHLEGIRIGPSGSSRGSSEFPGSNPSGGLDRARKRQTFTNRTIHRRARGEQCEKHGEKGSSALRTAQNTHSGRLKRRKRTLPKYLIPEKKDALFRVIEDPRDRAIFRLAYHHGLRASEIGMIQVKDWRRGTSLDMDRLFLRRLKGSIGVETILVNAAATALRAWLRIRGTSPRADLPIQEPPADLSSVTGRAD